MSIQQDDSVRNRPLSFEEVNKVNDEFRTFEERRRKLLELLYGKDADQRRGVPTKWLDNDSLIAAQSLVDSRVAKFDWSADRRDECIRARNWYLRRPISIEKLAAH